MGKPIHIPVSAGELLDKKTILEIKSVRLKDAVQLANVGHELRLLTEIAQAQLAATGATIEVARLESELRAINSELWDLENTVRAFGRAANFDQAFVQAARMIYAGNDRRAAVKRQINTLLQSSIVEEKNHDLS